MRYSVTVEVFLSCILRDTLLCLMPYSKSSAIVFADAEMSL